MMMVLLKMFLIVGAVFMIAWCLYLDMEDEEKLREMGVYDEESDREI